jgi:glutamate synthase (NADPH/NADH) small chain
LWSLGTTRFNGEGGAVSSVVCEPLDWTCKPQPVPLGKGFEFPAELVLLSMGFVPYRDSPLVREFSLATDSHGNIATDRSYRTSNGKVFAAGDAVTGASLVVKAISHGRSCAESVHEYLSCS